MTLQEWQGTEDLPQTKGEWWLKMKAIHAQQITELEIAQAKAMIALIGQHMVERDQLRQWNGK
tara:strand:+ start:290 stop:478 length:189 start_codon:yes stop_codon:yes gene_type:complete